MLEKIRSLLTTFFGDAPNKGITAAHLRRCIGAHSAQISRQNGHVAQITPPLFLGEAWPAEFFETDAALGADSAEPIPTELDDYIQKVVLHPYKVTDDDIAMLRQAGYSEDELFEITLSAALGAAQASLIAGLTVLPQGEAPHAT